MNNKNRKMSSGKNSGRKMNSMKRMLVLLFAAAFFVGTPLSAYIASAEETVPEVTGESVNLGETQPDPNANSGQPAEIPQQEQQQQPQEQLPQTDPPVQDPAVQPNTNTVTTLEPQPDANANGVQPVTTEPQSVTEQGQAPEEMMVLANSITGTDNVTPTPTPTPTVTPEPTETKTVIINETDEEKKITVSAENIPQSSILKVEEIKKDEDPVYQAKLNAVSAELSIEKLKIETVLFALDIAVEAQEGAAPLSDEVLIRVQGKCLENLSELVCLYRIDEQNKAVKVELDLNNSYDKVNTLSFKTKDFSDFLLIVPAEITPEPTAEPTQTPTPTPTAEPTQTPTPTPTAEPTQTPKPTATPTPTPTAEPTQTPKPTATPTPKPMATETPTPKPTATPTPTPSPTPATAPKSDARSITFNKAGENSMVSVTAENAPLNANLMISSVSQDVIELVEKSTISKVKYDVWFAVDINMGGTLQNSVNITLQSPKLANLPSGALLYHIDPARKTSYTYNKSQNSLTFRSKEFSPFMILVEKSKNTAASSIKDSAANNDVQGSGGGVPTYYPAGDNGTGYYGGGGGYNATGFGYGGFNETAMFGGMNNTNVTGFNDTNIAGFNDTDIAGKNGTNSTAVTNTTSTNTTGAKNETSVEKEESSGGGLSTGALIGIIAAIIAAAAVAFGVIRYLQSSRH